MAPPTRATRPRNERIAVAALVVYGVAVAFLLGPGIRAALGTEGQPVPDFAGPPAQSAAAARPGVGAPPAPPSLAAPDAGTQGDRVDSRPLPDLSAAQVERAVAIVESDRHFRAIVGETSYTLARTGPWTTANGLWTPEKRPTLIGASFVVAFPHAIGIEDKVMPAALWDVTERRSPPYQEVDLRVDADAVTNLMVLVDLRRGKVVNVSPGLGSKVLRKTPPRGFRREVPDLSNEYPDPAERPTSAGGER